MEEGNDIFYNYVLLPDLTKSKEDKQNKDKKKDAKKKEEIKIHLNKYNEYYRAQTSHKNGSKYK
jgi:hypothetical protein